MRKILFLFSLWLGCTLLASAETLELSDGSSLTGYIVKTDDNGLLLRAAGDAYTNVPWSKFSQAALKQLSALPKIKPLVEPFIEPDESQRPPKPEIKVNAITRLQRPEQPSLLGGLFGTGLGLFVLFVLYAANLYAAYEIATVRDRQLGQVMGLSAVFPVIGPIVFLALPVKVENPPEEEPVDTAVAEEAPTAAAEEITIVEASWRQIETQSAPQVFARGKFTFNKRFIETKFSGFIGEPKGDALKFTMEAKTTGAQFTVERIAQVTANEVIFDTTQHGQVVVPLTDIQEIILTPKTAKL